MPKVSSATFIIDGKHQKFDIYYSKKDQFEIKGFPAEIIELGKPEDRGVYGITRGWQTENELVNNFQSIIKLYHNKKATSKKVILFYLSATADIAMNKVSNGGYVGRKAGIHPDVRSQQDRGWGLTIQYYVAMRSENNGTRYNWIDDDGIIRSTITVTRDMQEIEWTPQREQTFRDICAAMEKMVMKISDTMYDQKKLFQLLDSGAKLLN
jgi:exo-beta-1,3-glucanase (GH17 family)